MANYTHTVDPNHLVTIGYEGFWGEYDTDVQYNPGNGWAGITGQNFTANNAHEEIDFAAIHYWPDEWFADVSSISAKLGLIVCCMCKLLPCLAVLVGIFYHMTMQMCLLCHSFFCLPHCSGLQVR